MGWSKNRMTFSEIQSLSTLSFSIEIKIHQIVLKEENRVFYERNFVPMDQSLEWSIPREIMHKLITAYQHTPMLSPPHYSQSQSQIFYEINGGYSRGSDMYCLTVQMDRSEIVFGLILCALRKASMNIDLEWTVEMIATGEEFNKVVTETMREELTINSISALGHFWSNNNMLSKWELMSCDSLILRVNITVHRDDAAKHAKAIDYWTKLSKGRKSAVEEHKSQIQQRFQSMEDQIDSLKAALEAQSSEIKQLRKDMMSSQGIQCSQENEASELQKWMENEVKLPQYFELLIENGFEDMESMRDITMEHLREMGMDKIGHRLKLMKSVATLRAMDR